MAAVRAACRQWRRHRARPRFSILDTTTRVICASWHRSRWLSLQDCSACATRCESHRPACSPSRWRRASFRRRSRHAATALATSRLQTHRPACVRTRRKRTRRPCASHQPPMPRHSSRSRSRFSTRCAMRRSTISSRSPACQVASAPPIDPLRHRVSAKPPRTLARALTNCTCSMLRHAAASRWERQSLSPRRAVARCRLRIYSRQSPSPSRPLRERALASRTAALRSARRRHLCSRASPAASSARDESARYNSNAAARTHARERHASSARRTVNGAHPASCNRSCRPTAARSPACCLQRWSQPAHDRRASARSRRAMCEGRSSVVRHTCSASSRRRTAISCRARLQAAGTSCQRVGWCGGAGAEQGWTGAGQGWGGAGVG